MRAHHAWTSEHFVEKISDLIVGEEVAHGSVWQCDNSNQMENRRGDVSEHESACTRVAAQFPQLSLRTYVGSQLRRDPIYFVAHELFRGWDEPILDIGCGLGLLAF